MYQTNDRFFFFVVIIYSDMICVAYNFTGMLLNILQRFIKSDFYYHKNIA